MRTMVVKVFVMITATLLICSSALAQWPTDPDSNMVICNHSGEQAIPKVAPTSDGGCYICWYDHESGNYDMYLQRLNAYGEIQWTENGMLVSDNPQATWLTDYEMTVDHDDNAIIAFNDTRAGDDWDIYAYKISPEGEFLWGEDGLTVSDNDGFEPYPQVCVTTGGNIVIAWQEESTIHIRKFDPDGNDYWSSPSVIDITSEYGMSIPRLAPAENDGVILQALDKTGPNYWDTNYIYLYKFSEYGEAIWGEGLLVSDAGGIGIQMFPEVCSDGLGGAISFWYDSRISNQLHAYAEHFNADGDPLWAEDGLMLSSNPSQFQMNPSVTYFPESGNVMAFYKTTNSLQSLSGIGGQLISGFGERLWGDSGVDILPLADKGRYSTNVFTFENDAIVVCFDSPDGDVVNNYVDAMRINVDGEHVWDESPLMISSLSSDKVHLFAAMTVNNQVLASWEDGRNGNTDIYLQNVNPDGTLGQYITGIEEAVNLPQNTGLNMAYPNPFNASTTISYSLEYAANVSLEIYDILGRKVETLVNGNQQAGNYQLNWKADQISTGIYFARMVTDGQSSMKKLVLLK